MMTTMKTTKKRTTTRKRKRMTNRAWSLLFPRCIRSFYELKSTHELHFWQTVVGLASPLVSTVREEGCHVLSCTRVEHNAM
jgi:hypothetical protein